MTLLSDRDLYAGKFGLPLSARYQHGEEDIRRALEEVRQQHPLLTPAEAEGRALARLDARIYAQQPKALITKRHNWRRWIQLGAFVLVSLLCLLFGVQAHCQIDVIQFQDNAGTTQATFAAPFKFKAGSNCSVARSGSVLTFNCAGGAAAAGGSNTQVQWNNATALAGISTMTTDGTIVTAKVGTNWLFVDPTDATKKVKFDASGITTGTTRAVAFPDADSRTIKNGSSTGQIPIWNNATSTFDVSDPLVQGTQAAGSTTIPNPVVIGGSDYGGTPAVQTAKVTSAGALQTHETGTAAISAASLPLPTGAATDASLTTLDTDVKSNVTLHAGSNIVGKVTTDQTTHGATDLVAADVTKVGGAAVALGQTTATASIPVVIASDQSPLAVFARTMPLLNYSSFTLQDANTVLWVTTMSDTGALSTVTTTSGTVLPLYFNDIATRSTYQIGVSTAGVLTETLVTFNPQYPAAIGFVTSGGKKSALLMNSAVFYALQPTSVADWNVAVADGGDVAEGAIADTKVTGDAGGTLSAKLRGINYSLAQIARQTNVSITAQIQPTRLVGALNQPIGTPASPISVLPANTSGCAGTTPQQTMSTPINMSTAVTTKMITGSASGWTYICASDLVVAGADNAALVYGTGSNCGTGTTALAGGTTAATGWNLAANGGLAKGNGQGIMWKVPPGNDTCLATSAAVQASGSLTFAQF